VRRSAITADQEFHLAPKVYVFDWLDYSARRVGMSTSPRFDLLLKFFRRDAGLPYGFVTFLNRAINLGLVVVIVR
jgi:hypothetical protein